MEIFFSAAAVLVCILAFVIGVSFGRSLPVKAEPVEQTPEEKQRTDEEKRALTQLFGYSVEQAYGGDRQ